MVQVQIRLLGLYFPLVTSAQPQSDLRVALTLKSGWPEVVLLTNHCMIGARLGHFEAPIKSE